MNRTIQRTMAAGLASLMLTASVLTTRAAQVTDFQDVQLTAWYYQAVDYATREGLFAGTSPTTFSPDLGMTRGMFVTVLGRMAGQSGEVRMASRFTDYLPPFCASDRELAFLNLLLGLQEKNWPAFET